MTPQELVETTWKDGDGITSRIIDLETSHLRAIFRHLANSRDRWVEPMRSKAAAVEAELARRAAWNNTTDTQRTIRGIHYSAQDYEGCDCCEKCAGNTFYTLAGRVPISKSVCSKLPSCYPDGRPDGRSLIFVKDTLCPPTNPSPGASKPAG